jgi:hypothetical protein
MIATVSEASVSKFNDLEKRCNQLILQVMSKKSEELIAERDIVCKKANFNQ